ncbi:unnamed protein product, partial [Prorocentrum cordatum]
IAIALLMYDMNKGGLGKTSPQTAAPESAARKTSKPLSSGTSPPRHGRGSRRRLKRSGGVGFQRGVVAVRYGGQLCTHTGRLQGTDYLCELGGGLCVDARQYCSEAAFINHFCGIAGAPNCEIEGVPAERVILIRTTRDIPRGEELLVDYGPSYCLESGVPHPRVPDWAREFARHPY